ncbi:hypothetical protein ACJIZ3_002645 [Penstemon smallii]|uniref:Protein kinase domain-containing protein n=1 Tax=Penstemon smallii TaxID=265156 RepID=A0ABD3UAB9_9LAMI
MLKVFLLLAFLFLNLELVFNLSLPRLSSEAEWRGLLGLRSSLGITAKDWRKKVNPCFNWTGIECKNGHVIRINLSGLRRTREGKLNPRFSIDSLQNFRLLSSFNSSGFSLPGSIPEWLGQRLSNLEVLDLSSSSIHGSIPSSFGSLSKLSSLNLSGNSITGTIPPALGKLISLSDLDLSENLLTGQIPSEISSLGNLTNLDLSLNFLSSGIPVEFGSLSHLKILSLSNNSLSGSVPAQLGNLSKLAKLDLGYNSLEGSLLDSFFQRMIRLEYLDLSRNNFNGRLPDALWSMSRLTFLDVSGNKLTGAFPNLISSFNVTSAIFNFSNNMFYGKLIIGSVNVFDVSNNYLEGSVPSDVRSNIIISDNCFSNVQNQRNSNSCLEFYTERGLYFGDDSAPEPPLTQPPKTSKKLTFIMIGAFGGIGFIVVLTTGFLLLVKTCNIGSRNVSPVLGGGIEPPPKDSVDFSTLEESFTYEQMLLATSNFSNSNLIRRGHSGDLFRGTLEDGCPVVVKRVDLRVLRKELFMLELDLLNKVTHPRLVPLVGHCLEDENEKILVYKYMPNGDLSNSLYRGEEDMQSLDWITRLKIAIGVAEALSYLHHECNPPVVHRDIQASSILLDDKYEVRLGSLSEICYLEANNHQNMIARLLRTPQTSGKRHSGSSSTCAYDVHCFGKVLLELVTGKLGISRLNDTDTKQWLESNIPFISINEKELLNKIVDQSLHINDDLLEEVWAVAIVAKSCLNPKASRRPSMRHVLRALENPFKVVRGENSSSSSSWSWTTAAFFGSWHRSSSDGSNMSSHTNKEIIGGCKRVGSRGSGVNEYSSSSHKRISSDVFPEPVEIQDEERRDD